MNPGLNMSENLNSVFVIWMIFTEHLSLDGETVPRQAALVDARKLAKIFIMSAGQGFINVQYTI